MRLLITGGRGFLGSRLIAALAGQDEVSVFALHRGAEAGPVGDGVEWLRCDLSDGPAVASAVDKIGPDAVVHAAASLHGGTDGEAIRACARDNVLAQANLTSAAMAVGCERYVFCSTISVYGGPPPRDAGWREDDPAEPTEAYGWSKRAAEELLSICASSHPSLGAVSLRLAGIHGPGKISGVVYNLMRAALRGEPLIVNEPDSRFRLAFLDDAVGSVRAALASGPARGYDCYNVAGDEIFTLRELAVLIREITGSSSKIQAAEGSRVRNQVLDTTRIKGALDFQPTPLAENLAAYADSLRDQIAGDE